MTCRISKNVSGICKCGAILPPAHVIEPALKLACAACCPVCKAKSNTGGAPIEPRT